MKREEFDPLQLDCTRSFLRSIDISRLMICGCPVSLNPPPANEKKLFITFFVVLFKSFTLISKSKNIFLKYHFSYVATYSP